MEIKNLLLLIQILESTLEVRMNEIDILEKYKHQNESLIIELNLKIEQLQKDMNVLIVIRQQLENENLDLKQLNSNYVQKLN
jgi:hypothetical protein